MRDIAGGRARKPGEVGRQIAFAAGAGGADDPQVELRNLVQHRLPVRVRPIPQAGFEPLRLASGDELVIGIEQLVEGHAAFGHRPLGQRLHLVALARRISDEARILGRGIGCDEAVEYTVGQIFKVVDLAMRFDQTIRPAPHPFTEIGKCRAHLLAVAVDECGTARDLVALPVHEADKVNRTAQRIAHSFEARLGAVTFLDACVDLPHQPFGLAREARDGAADFLGGGARARSQFLHLACDNRKGAPGIASTLGLNCGVKREHVGGLGDRFDAARNGAHLLHRSGKVGDVSAEPLDEIGELREFGDGGADLLRARRDILGGLGRENFRFLGRAGNLRLVRFQIGRHPLKPRQCLDLTRQLFGHGLDLPADFCTADSEFAGIGGKAGVERRGGGGDGFELHSDWFPGRWFPGHDRKRLTAAQYERPMQAFRLASLTRRAWKRRRTHPGIDVETRPAMFFQFLDELRLAGIPASLKEHLILLEALDREVIERRPEEFYYLARATYVKDEGLLDRFDQVFAKVFKGIEQNWAQEGAEIPSDWLKSVAEKFLTPEEMEEIKALGSWEEIMETLKKRLEEQEKRHEGGNKWIGTGGTSPYGNSGYNPEGVRIGGESKHKRAVKVWDKREFRNLDNTRELGTRNIKIALRRLRRFAREGAQDELDLDATINGTARQGWLDIHMRAERRNAIKVLLFLDVGGSMDPFIKLCEELFSAASSEFKNLEFFYFHNCPYEGVWKDNKRRFSERTPTWDVLHKFGHDYKLIFVGDAAMSPYEITHPGGSVEHFNEESGAVWLQRLTNTYPAAAWLNPVPEQHWGYSQSTKIIQQAMSGRMFPLTLDGLDDAMRELTRKR